MLSRVRVSIAAAAATALVGGVGLAEQTAWAQSRGAAASDQTVKVAARRITESQYRHTIAALFGPQTLVNARFEPERREDGLLAVGSTSLSITPSGFEQYFALARSISDQVLDPKRREAVVGCAPADPAKADAACTRAFVERYGEPLFRRPLTSAEVAARVKTAETGAVQAGDFYAGLEFALTSLLMAPEYLFRIEVAEPDPARARQYRLDA